MNYSRPVTLHEKLKHLDRRENLSLIGKIDTAKCRLAELLGDIGCSPSVHDKAYAEINELSKRIATLHLVVDAIYDEFTSFQCGLDGLIEMLARMGEKDINTIHLLHLLMPLNRQFREANTEFDGMVAV